jgi:hypothetical protein
LFLLQQDGIKDLKYKGIKDSKDLINTWNLYISIEEISMEQSHLEITNIIHKIANEALGKTQKERKKER